MDMDHNYSSEGQPSSKKKRITSCCCVPQCRTYFSSEISFHLFPKDPVLKQKWEAALNMGKSPSNSMRVCSQHFVARDYFPVAVGAKRHRLFPHAVPSQRIPQWLDDKPGGKVQMKHKQSSPLTDQCSSSNRRLTEENIVPKEANVQIKIEMEDGNEEEENLNPKGKDIQIKQEIEDPEEAEEYTSPQFEMVLVEGTVKQYQYDKCTQVNMADQRTSFIEDEEGWSLADIICEHTLDKTTQVHFKGSEK